MSERTHDEPIIKATSKKKSHRVKKRLSNPRVLLKSIQDPKAARPEAIQRLQQMYGNRAVRGLIQRETYITYSSPGVSYKGPKRLTFRDIRMEIGLDKDEE